MKANYELKKEEASRRMLFLNMLPACIMNFVDYGTVYISRENGKLDQLEDEEKELVKRMEEKHNMLVYHVIDTVIYGARMLTLFFVSEDIDEWKYDNLELIQERQNCYVFNCDNIKFSEMGRVGFLPVNGGLIRTW